MLKKQFSKKVFIYFLIISFAFFLDRISKIYILNLAESSGAVNIPLTSFLNFILVWNTGIGFGLFSFDGSTMYNLITILIVIVNLIIIYLMLTSNDIR